MLTIPTKSLGCCAVPLTPASPTIPIAKPAARPARPTERPAPSWMKPWKRDIFGATTDSRLVCTRNLQGVESYGFQRLRPRRRVHRSAVCCSERVGTPNRSESTHSNDTSHDDRDNTLHHQIWAENRHRRNANTRLGRSITSWEV